MTKWKDDFAKKYKTTSNVSKITKQRKIDKTITEVTQGKWKRKGIKKK